MLPFRLYGSCAKPSPKPLSDTGMPMPSSGGLNTTKIALLPVESVLMRASSIATSATQPLGRQRTNATRPMSLPSMLRPSPLGSSTPSGARTRSRLAFLSAVFSTMTERPTFGWSSAVTFWMMAHCWKLAPGGVSQLTCQSPYCALTTPCAPAPPMPMRSPAAPSAVAATARTRSRFTAYSTRAHRARVSPSSRCTTTDLGEPSRLPPISRERGGLVNRAPLGAGVLAPDDGGRTRAGSPQGEEERWIATHLGIRSRRNTPTSPPRINASARRRYDASRTLPEELPCPLGCGLGGPTRHARQGLSRTGPAMPRRPWRAEAVLDA